MKKKLISALLCTAMAVSLLAGCSGGDDSQSSSSGSSDGNYDEFITVDVYDELANYQGVQNGWFAEIVKEKFNMELNFISPNVAGGGDTLYQTRTAAGDLGDLIIINTSNGKLNDLVESGLVMDCTDLLEGKDIMTNYSDAIQATNETLTEEEGVWAFPNSVSTLAATEPSEGLEPTFGTYVRWDYYAELGYPEMKNLDDFLDVMEDMQALAREKEGDDNIYAFSFFKDWDDGFMNDAKQIACMYGYDACGFTLLKADGSDVQSMIDDDSMYKTALQFYFEANQRGLVDPESTTQNYDTWSNKFMNGKTLYCPWPWASKDLYNTTENTAEGKGYMLAPVEDMQIFSYGNCPEGNSTGVLAIGSNADDPQRMADFIDWLYSPEGIELNSSTAAGIEGLTWEMNDEGKAELTEYGVSALPSNEVEVPEEYGGGNYQDGISALNFKTVNLTDIDPNINEPYMYTLWETTIANNQNPLTEDWTAQTGANTTMEYLQNNNMLIVAPGSGYTTPAEDSSITTVRSQCKETIVDASWQAVFASSQSEFDSIWSTMQETAIGLGYEDILAVDQQNAADWTAAREESAANYPAEEAAE